jgi:radical SAM superfamily enzyme YgiQ (UPF0313 family)
VRLPDKFGVRRVLLVFPHYAPSFGTLEFSYPLTDGMCANMPPQGLLVIAAYLPACWELRFVDENIRRATAEDFLWAEVVFVSGMHIQRRQIEDLCQRAHTFGRAAVLGGSSVSACPHYYPTFDYLHVGELGDATDELVKRLARDPARPERQVMLKTMQRHDLTDFPVPRYELAELKRYFLVSIQFSSGCPYVCEFCDIPNLYGRNPRLKTPAQITAELDKLLECESSGWLYFVDDNFIGNRKAARELLPHLIAWQKRNGYPFVFGCEATLNVAKRPEILELMRKANFYGMFCGIETPEPEALKAIAKDHNLMVPILDSITTLNSYGIEVFAGIILGFDTDTPKTGERLVEFIDQSKIPILLINLLQALPVTPLWDRLERSGRIVDDESRESNVEFLMPYEQVMTMYRDVMLRVYDPKNVFARFEHQVKATYPNRRKRELNARLINWRNFKRGLNIISRVVWYVGVRGDYKRVFWKFALRRLIRGDIECVLRVAIGAHHLIRFTREATSGRANASYYSHRDRSDVLALAAE